MFRTNSFDLSDVFFNIFDNETPAAKSVFRFKQKDMKDAIVLDIEVPGFGASEIEVSVEDDKLSVKRARGSEARSQTWELSREIDPDAISSSVKDGLLTVTLPKRAATKARKIEVKG